MFWKKNSNTIDNSTKEAIKMPTELKIYGMRNASIPSDLSDTQKGCNDTTSYKTSIIRRIESENNVSKNAILKGKKELSNR